MTKAKRLSTHRQYNTYLTAWFNHCQDHSLSPTQATVPQALAFLDALRHTRSLSYSATNTARSALSSIICTPDRQPFGQHPFVKLYLRGVFNTNPPVPKYNDTWDPDIVLTLLRNWAPAQTLDLKKLTLKVVMLVLLVTGQRVQTLEFLDIRYMKQSRSSITFVLPSLIKQSRPGFSNPPIKLRSYAPDRRLCIYVYLTEYLKRTKTLRNSDTALFLTFKAPHHKASKDTIARWIRGVLTFAGIDTSKYGPHSVRAASVSAAKRGGATVQDILSTVGWTSCTTFARYYDKNLDRNTAFDVAVLNK